jgi:hypothetical protein
LPSTTSTSRIRHFPADLLDVRRHEVDHALEPHREFAQRLGRADRQWLEVGTGEFHADHLNSFDHFGACKSAAKRTVSSRTAHPDRRFAPFGRRLQADPEPM